MISRKIITYFVNDADKNPHKRAVIAPYADNF